MAKSRFERLNKEQRVLANWQQLRITRTELIEGYKKNARRRPLSGLTARADDAAGRTSVIIEGPNTTIIERKRRERMADNDEAARKFVVAFNLASHQAPPGR